jgi:hypothetical protein
VFAIISIRTYKRFLLPEIWAEDGAVFLQDAYNMSPVKSLFGVYAGYVHMIPRLFSYFLVLLPVSIIPYVLFLFCFVITGLTLSYFLREEFSYLAPSVPLRGLLCALLAFSLPFNEVFGNICNLQWFLNIFLVFFALSDVKYKHKKWQIAVYALSIFSSGFFPVIFFLIVFKFAFLTIVKGDKTYLKENIVLAIVTLFCLILFCVNIIKYGGGRMADVNAIFSIKYLIAGIWYYVYSIICFPLKGLPEYGFSISEQVYEMIIPLSCFAICCYKLIKERKIKFAVASLVLGAVFYMGLILFGAIEAIGKNKGLLLSRYYIFLIFTGIFLWVYLFAQIPVVKYTKIVLFLGIVSIASSSFGENRFFIEPYGYDNLWKKNQAKLSYHIKNRSDKQTRRMESAGGGGVFHAHIS